MAASNSNISLMIVLMILFGVVFVYAAIKNKDPREIAKDALRRKK